MSKWEPNARYLSVADMRAPANDKMDSPIAVPKSLKDFQEVFLNFHFNGSALLFDRPAVNAIHFRNPPVPLQVSSFIKYHVNFYSFFYASCLYTLYNSSILIMYSIIVCI